MNWISCKDKLPNKSGYYITLVLFKDGIIRTAVMKYKYYDPEDEKYGFWIYRTIYNTNTKSPSVVLEKDYTQSYQYKMGYETIFLVLYWSEIDFKEEDWINVVDKVPEKSGYYFVKALFKDGITRIGLSLFNYYQLCEHTSKDFVPQFFIPKDYYILVKQNPVFFLPENNEDEDAFYLHLNSSYQNENLSIMYWSFIPEQVLLSKEDSIKNNIIISNRVCR